ncbi:MAG: DegV family protein [Asgard group archaeon]|nr:DegV family protein [Asgard group archaeon]
MQKVAIITDGSCDLPEELIKKYNINVVPFKVNFGLESYKLYGDSGEISKEEFYRRLADSPEMPTTGVPSPKSFYDAFQKASTEAKSVIAILLSQGLSGAIQNAVNVRKQFDGQDITIVDSKVSASCLGLLVLEAAKMAVKGSSKEEILARLDELIPQTRLVVTVDTMEYLYRGGRIGKAKKLFGQALSIKPILHFEDGIVTSGGTIRGRDEVIKRIKFMAPFVIKNAITDEIFIWHTQDEETANEILEIMKKANGNGKEIRIQEAGPIIGTHVGPKSLGFTYIGKYNKNWLLKMDEN